MLHEPLGGRASLRHRDQRLQSARWCVEAPLRTCMRLCSFCTRIWVTVSVLIFIAGTLTLLTATLIWVSLCLCICVGKPMGTHSPAFGRWLSHLLIVNKRSSLSFRLGTVYPSPRPEMFCGKYQRETIYSSSVIHSSSCRLSCAGQQTFKRMLPARRNAEALPLH